uniref:Uncharacterized protein n=1 Tax=mine drainage metagenome TaxID=410659 RepID=E6PG29_9ZZZZ
MPFQSTPGRSAGRILVEQWTQYSYDIVSIHARPLGRANLTSSSALTHCLKFQSTPGRSAGRIPGSDTPRSRSLRFQSTPGRSAGRILAIDADSLQPE